MALAVLTGAGAWLFDRPFLTSYFRYLDLPVFGRIPIASALLFDLAVFLLVVGATALVLIARAHQSIRKPDLRGGRTPFSVRRRRATDFLIAIAAGFGITLIAYAVMTRPMPESVSRFFIERAYPDAGGTNVVNVILVDFRGFDTLGEITVLGIVALTVFSLLRRFRPAPESVGAP
jgi:multicomponent K+:H+ antiporter subunit A